MNMQGARSLHARLRISREAANPASAIGDIWLDGTASFCPGKYFITEPFARWNTACTLNIARSVAMQKTVPNPTLLSACANQRHEIFPLGSTKPPISPRAQRERRDRPTSNFYHFTPGLNPAATVGCTTSSLQISHRYRIDQHTLSYAHFQNPEAA